MIESNGVTDKDGPLKSARFFVLYGREKEACARKEKKKSL